MKRKRNLYLRKLNKHAPKIEWFQHAKLKKSKDSLQIFGILCGIFPRTICEFPTKFGQVGGRESIKRINQVKFQHKSAQKIQIVDDAF